MSDPNAANPNVSDPNLLNQAGHFAEDAAVDTSVDGFVNQAIGAVAAHIPGGAGVQQMLTTEVDQVINNDINAELNKGVGGMLQDVEGLFGHRQG